MRNWKHAPYESTHYAKGAHALVVAVILLFVSAGDFTRTAYAASQCEPLLLLIEGGGWSIWSRGQSIRTLAAELVREYRDKNVTVSTVDHRAFMRGGFGAEFNTGLAMRDGPAWGGSGRPSGQRHRELESLADRHCRPQPRCPHCLPHSTATPSISSCDLGWRVVGRPQ